MTPLTQAQNELIYLLSDQIVQIKMSFHSPEDLIQNLKGDLTKLSIIYKMELGNVVIAEIHRLQSEIQNLQNQTI